MLFLAACNRGGEATPAPETAAPLVTYAAHRVAVTPTARVRADTSALARMLGGARGAGARLDSAIAARVRAAGFGERWLLPEVLERAYERNRTYAADPGQLAVEPIRTPTFEAGKRYGEPLASQLRTMIALHEDTRYVLLPIELRLEGDRAVLRAALLDPRFAEGRWVGEIASDSASGSQTLTQIAERVVGLFIAP